LLNWSEEGAVSYLRLVEEELHGGAGLCGSADHVDEIVEVKRGLP
jgi:hypothetical protein